MLRRTVGASGQVTAGEQGARRRRVAIGVAAVTAAVLCGAVRDGFAQTPSAPPAGDPRSVAAPVPVPFPDAVAKVARALFAQVKPPEGRTVEVVIDPLLDGLTGLHTVAAAEAGRRLVEIAREFPQVRMVPFTAEALARKPILLIGTITAVQNAEQSAGQSAGAQVPKAYTVWFTAADSGSQQILAKAQAPALSDGVDVGPTAAEADSPAWRRDAAVEGYIESCRKTKVGEALRPAYVEQLPISAVVAEANRVYTAKRYGEALALYRKAAEMPGGEQLRVLNGIYLALDRLGRKKEAEEAFGRVVGYGLAQRDLAVKLLFRPGSPEFVRSRDTRSYPMWLSRIAARAAQGDACLEIVGHTSPTGPAAVNERLSALRAETVRDRLDAASRGLGKRIVARGAGSRETIVGTGRDDASDSLDRRVEFKVMGCS
jgi:outer membrane protein OmpA-like peptidoglycan-associated protein